jgi:peptidoglycan/LPS O-acetylase OafA/YrhL
MWTLGSSGHCASLDGIRGIAILAVMAFHQDIPGFTRGYLGVDLFLVLSGFLITSLLAREFATQNEVSLKAFWIRRTLRLLPLYLLYVSLLTLGHLGGVFQYNGESAANHLLKTWLYARNLSFTSEAELLWNEVGISGHLWSLSLEEQFYLVWPFLCVFMLRGGAWRRLIVPLLLVFHLVALQLAEHWYAAAFPPWTRGISSTTGCAVALALVWYPRFARWLEQPWVQPICAALVVGIWTALTLSPWCEALEAHQYVLPALLVPLALLCSALWQSRDTLASRALSLPPLAYLGRISYGMYMWHSLCLGLTVVLLPTDEAIMLLTPLLTIAVAAVSYALFEKPFLRAKSRFASRKAPAQASGIA